MLTFEDGEIDVDFTGAVAKVTLVVTVFASELDEVTEIDAVGVVTGAVDTREEGQEDTGAAVLAWAAW